MLTRLTVRNFAIVDYLDVEWGAGFNVITGETGAGKSIIVDAVGALLGDRLGPEMVRTGADRALIEGVFVLPTPPPADLAHVLAEYGLEPEDGALIVAREVAGAGGRGGARINGRAVPLAVLQELGEQLVDVHGQSQHMALLRVREHLDFLDRYAGLLAEREAVAGLVRAVRQAREAAQALRAEERQALREQEMLRHEVAEIERAAPREGEEEEIEALRNRLRHVERLREATTAAYQALNGYDASEVERPGATDLLGQAVLSAGEASAIDPALASTLETLNGALAAAEEAARDLRTYLETVEADPEALEQAEARLIVLSDLKRKYGASVGEVLRYLAQARERLGAIEARDERIAELEARERELRTQLGVAVAALSTARSAAGARLAAAVEAELADLSMSGTRFAVSIGREESPEGVQVDGRTLAFDTTGIDRVEFLIAANRGEEPRPLQRVASGGELARIALALKTILARADTRATLIFDEVDVGVGGRTAPVVGEKLWSLGHAGHQVLCVTHMPQVAAYADQHWVVSKESAAERARTRVARLEPEAQLEELAAMLAGSVTSSARESARELLSRAAATRGRAGRPPAPEPAGAPVQVAEPVGDAAHEPAAPPRRRPRAA